MNPYHVCRPIIALCAHAVNIYPGYSPVGSLETSQLAPVVLSACTNPRNSSHTCTFLLSSRACNMLYLVLLLIDQLESLTSILNDQLMSVLLSFLQLQAHSCQSRCKAEINSQLNSFVRKTISVLSFVYLSAFF